MKKIIALLAIVGSALLAAAQMPQQFSADMKMHSSRGMDMTGKFYFGGKKIRMDMNSPRGQMYNIINSETQTADMVMPEQKMYMEMKGMGRGPGGSVMKDLRSYDPNDPCKSISGHACKKAGTDTVDGRTCDKWEITDTKSGETSTVCVDQKLHFPIKTTTGDSSIEFTNVKEGAQDASLFEVPAGYQKMEGMGPMMGGPRRPQ